MSKRERRAEKRQRRKETQGTKSRMDAEFEARAVRGEYTQVRRGQEFIPIPATPISPEEQKRSALVVGFYSSPSRRAKTIVESMFTGVKRSEDVPLLREQKTYKSPENFSAVVFYGLRDNLLKVYQDYRQKGVSTVFWDMGYWGRGKGEPLSGYHRCAVNALQPTEYFWKLKAPGDRFARFRLKLSPWRKTGKEIFLAGLSDKNASVLHRLGLIHTPDPTAYSVWLRDEIRKHTDRPIAYRPKPSWKGARPIEGTRWAMKPGIDGLLWELRDTWAVITFRSNVAIDGLVAGIPCFVVGDGVAKLMGHTDLSKIEDPLYPDNREEFCANLAYCQWHYSEMAQGEVWKFLRDRGLIP